MRLLTAAAATTAVVATLLVPATAQAVAPEVPREPGDTLTLPLRDALGALPVVDEDRTGYDRSKFRHWVDTDRDGCDTREEVLLEEAFIDPQVGTGCRVSGGQWYSPYDDTYVDGPRALDIDHLVPLAESWDSGASAWTAKEREAYANDLGDARSLIAVTGRSNRSKADQDPAEWMPPTATYHCQYIADWVATKLRWQLSVDSAEQATLAENAARCPNVPLKISLAR